jgi:hypothetical protein
MTGLNADSESAHLFVKIITLIVVILIKVTTIAVRIICTGLDYPLYIILSEVAFSIHCGRPGN